MGEGGLLDRLVAGAEGAAGADVLVGPGDDAAVWTPPPGMAVAVTQDALVEGVDFLRAWTTPCALGRRAMAVALSDLAAMGAAAHSCVATVCAPATTRADDVAAIQAGMRDYGETTGCVLVGGDVSAIDGPLVIDVCALGVVDPVRILRRDAGRPGDLLVVTGVLGRAAAGLRLLRDLDGAPPAAGDGGHLAAWRAAQSDPQARLREGAALAAAGVRCAGDLSDGLVVDASRTAAASGCAAEIWLDSVPVDPELRAAFPQEWAELAIAGGEDFELLAALVPERLDGLLTGWSLTPLTVVGRLTSGAGLRLLDREGGVELAVPVPRSRHFA